MRIDITIQEEPSDKKDYCCSPLSQIYNNCKVRNYEWVLFPPVIAPNQLKQEVANCSMVAALEAISHVPRLPNSIFDSDFDSKQKTFKVNFRQSDGTIEHYIIENDFPQINETLKFMKPLENEAYAIIFEKAWAVYRGGYKELKRGHTNDVLNKVLGTTSKDKFNKRMGVFEIDVEKYLKHINKYNEESRKDTLKKVQEIKEGDEQCIKILEKKDDKDKIDPKEAFELIRKAQQNDGGIITVSYSTGKYSGHTVSVLGTLSLLNPLTNKMQDFVILKNPWRAGDDILEKLNIIEIENMIEPFKGIIEINSKHYVTGVFYMPREYFEKWFRNILICMPNYQKYYPEVYDCINLYKEVANYYQIKPDQYYFDVNQGKNLLKTDIMSKEKFEALKKCIQYSGSLFTYVYEKQAPLSIWYEGEYTENISDCVFVKDKNSGKFNIKKKNEIRHDDFDKNDVYLGTMNFIKKDKIYSIINLNKINSYNELNQNNDNCGGFDVNKIMKDINIMNQFSEEIREFLRDKYIFFKEEGVRHLGNGWINTFTGINLVSEEREDNHYHVYDYGPVQNTNLSDLIGSQFDCRCYYLENGKKTRECRKKFTFKRTLFFYNCTYYINGAIKTTKPDKRVFYYLEKEKEKIQFIGK